ncbi:hypothetical protein IX326_001488 [Porphyromonas levii]|nr:hypothetical protein [Porphyromonas levii]
MKSIFMKSILKIALIAFSLSSILLMTSCTKDFEKINTNPLYPTDDEIIRDDIAKLGTHLPALQMEVVFLESASNTTGRVNDYQILNNLTAENWVGYMAPGENKWPGKSLTQYYFDTGWNNMGFNCLVPRILNPWIQIKNETMVGDAKNEKVFAIAQISKIMGLHKATDMFGALPYSKAGSGSFTVEYDSQEEIYTSFLKELKEAVDVLSNLQGATVRTTDYVYSGNSTKWVKLGNSLMLRLAMRISYVKPELAKEYVAMACNHPVGLIDNVADQAQITTLGEGGDSYNALSHIVEKYGVDARMGASIQCYLAGYGDPRLQKYFTGNVNIAIPPAVPSVSPNYEKAGKPNIPEKAPTVWMRASEVAFLKAEAILKGFISGSVKAEYERGIKLSFIEQGVDESLYESYIASVKKPAEFKDIIHPKYSSPAPSSITPKWDESADNEKKLERIITQKYLALFPNGQEAWSEWRRTGYPLLVPSVSTISNYGVIKSDGHKDGVRCWPYPPVEFNLNKENVQKAISQYKGGSNEANVNVWWDVKVKN